MKQMFDLHIEEKHLGGKKMARKDSAKKIWFYFQFKVAFCVRFFFATKLSGLV